VIRSQVSRGAALVAGLAAALALLNGSCMGEGDCPVYDYAPASAQVTFYDKDTGALICGARTSAKPGVLLPLEGSCAFLLAGWYSTSDAGLSTTVELTVQGYLPESVTSRRGRAHVASPCRPCRGGSM